MSPRQKKKKHIKEVGLPNTLPPSSEPPQDQENSSKPERWFGPRGLDAESRIWRRLRLDLAENGQWLLALFVLALVLRFFRIWHQELWLDEILVIKDASQGTNEYISNAHRLHLTITGWILNSFGLTAFWARFWSAVTGTLTVPIIGVAGLWFGDKRMGLLWGLFALLNPFLIFYSQDANYYGTMMLLASVQLACFVVFFQGAALTGLFGILVAGAVSYFNHPFSILFTGLVAGGCVIGSIISPSLRHQIYELKPRRWGRNPAVPIAAIALILAWPVVSQITVRSWMAFQKFRGSGNEDVIGFSLELVRNAFTSYGVTYYLRQGIAKYFTVVPFLAFVGGIITLALHARRDRTALSLGLLALATPIFCFSIISVLQHHGFYPRYFTFFVPLFLGTIASLCYYVGQWFGKSPRDRSRIAFACAGVILLIQIPYLTTYYFSDRANFRHLADVLKENMEDGEELYVADHNEWPQVSWYLKDYVGNVNGSNEPPFIDPGNKFDGSRINYLLYHLYGKESAWVVSSWRYPEQPHLWRFLDTAMPPVFHGHSPHKSVQNAHLHHWTYGKRVLLRTTATRFSDEQLAAEGVSRWFAQGGGKWNLKALGDVGKTTLTIEKTSTGEMLNVDLENGSLLSVDEDTILSITTDGLNAGVTIQAEPVFADRFEISPLEFIDYPDSQRHSPGEFDGSPVFKRYYDGVISYMLWSPPDERRHLILKAVRRNKEDLLPVAGISNPSAFICFEVAIDGVHKGTWRIPPGEKQIVRIVTDIDIPPGNHRVDIYGFTFRTRPVKANPWQWAGLEWNKGESDNPARTFEEAGAEFIQLPAPILSWGEPGGTQLNPYFEHVRNNYVSRISPDVIGPSGLNALEFDLSEPALDNENGWHYVGGEYLDVEPGDVLAFSTYVKAEETDHHSFQLALFMKGEDGTSVTRVGDQQLITSRYSRGWRRYVQMTIVPNDVVAIAPGIAIFQPGKKSNPKGKFYVDAIVSLSQNDKPLVPVNLDPGLFFAVEH